MQALAPAQREAVLRVVAALRARPGALLEILHGVQAELGFIPPAAVPVLAQEPNLREVIAFPMTQNAEDLLMNAPAAVSEKQLRELHIRVVEPGRK